MPSGSLFRYMEVPAEGYYLSRCQPQGAVRSLQCKCLIVHTALLVPVSPGLESLNRDCASIVCTHKLKRSVVLLLLLSFSAQLLAVVKSACPESELATANGVPVVQSRVTMATADIETALMVMPDHCPDADIPQKSPSGHCCGHDGHCPMNAGAPAGMSMDAPLAGAKPPSSAKINLYHLATVESAATVPYRPPIVQLTRDRCARNPASAG